MLRPHTPRRGFQLALETFALLARQRDDFEVHSFGANPDQLAPYELPFPVLHHGRVPNHELPDLYAAAYCFTDFSQFHGFGRTIAEAFACGVPAVVTQSGGAESFCRDAHNCLTAPIPAPGPMAQRLAMLLENPRLRDRLAQNARATVRHFDRIHSARQTYNFLNAIAKPNQP